MTTKTGVLYLQKDKFQIYSPFLSSIVEFRFVPEIIRDLDVVNNGLLENLIKVFVTNGKFAPSNLIIILCDNTYFVRDFVLPNPEANPKTPQTNPAPQVTMENLQEAADSYIEHVPYDNVVSKTFPLKNGIRVCAANQDFYEAFKLSFEKLGFTVESVLPGLVLGNNISAKPVMDIAMATGVLQRSGALKQYDLLTQQTFIAEKDKAESNDDIDLEEPQNKKSEKKRLFALVGLLATLVIILIIVFVQSQTPPTPPQQPAQAQTPDAAVKPANTINASVPSPIPTLYTKPSLAILPVENIVIQIVNTTQSASAAQSLRTQLTKYAFKSITLQSQSSVNVSNTLISFSATVDQPTRNAVLDEVRKLESNISVQDKQTQSVDISIILAN